MEMINELKSRHQFVSLGNCQLWLGKPAIVLVAAAALLVLLSATWSQPTAVAPVAYRLSYQTYSGCEGSSLSDAASPAAAAGKKNASIIVAVTAKASSWKRRTWLRGQFYKNVELLRKQDPGAADGVVLKFVIGSIGLSETDRNQTRAEQQKHGDLLMLDIPDSNTPDPPPDGHETATSLKVVYSVKWAIKHYNFPWFVRLGDDAYFRVDHFLLNVAATLSKKKLVFGYADDPHLGYIFSHGVTIRRYASGMGFIMTHDVAQYISDNAAVLHKGYPEDAVVGLWLAGTHFKLQHDSRFHDWIWRKCSDQSIIIHKHDYGTVDGDGVMRSCFPRWYHRFFSKLG